MTIALYYSSGSCSLAPHIILNEIGEPFELREFSTAKGANFSEEYIAINPKARIPVLAIDDYIVTENPAILTVLGKHFPDAALYPNNNPQLEARCLELLAWSSNTVHVAFAQIFRPERYVLNDDDFALVKASGKVNYAQCLSEIEAILKKQKYALGDNFSVVDPFWLVFYRWGLVAEFDMRQQYPAYTQHIERLCKRDSVKKALNTEGLSVW